MNGELDTQSMFDEAKQCFLEGDYGVAEPLLQQLILRNSRNPEVYQMLGTLLYDRGQFNKAIKIFKRALEIDPTYTDASLGLSIILNDLGRYEEGRQIFDEAQKLLNSRKTQSDPFFEEKIASKHEELADLYLQVHKPKEALDQLLKALQFSSRKTDLSLRVADVYVSMNEPEKAVRELKLLSREYPHVAVVRLKLGDVLYNIGQVAEATEHWEAVLMRDPQNQEAQRKLKMAQATGVTTLNYW